MAVFSFGSGHPYPDGTVVKAYPDRGQLSGGEPIGVPATTTSTVAVGGGLTFTGLADGAHYWAVAQVGGNWRWMGFSTDAIAAGGDTNWLRLPDGSLLAESQVADGAANLRVGGEALERLSLLFGTSSQGFDLGDGTTKDLSLRRVPAAGGAAYGTLGIDQKGGAGGVVRLDHSGWINVKDFGARGDGSTDDRAAIQAAIQYVVDNFAYGGVVYFPPGKYMVDCAAVGIVLPNNLSISLVGSGNPTTVSPACTLIQRKAGTATLIGNVDGGETQRWRGRIENLRIDGGGFGGRVAYFKRLGDAHFRKLRFSGQATGQGVPGVEFASAWNCHCEDVHFIGLGNGTAQPAVLINTVPGDVTDGTTSGFYFTSGCEWEKNNGTDLHIGLAGVYEIVGVIVVGAKFEGNSGTVAPMVRFGQIARNNHIIGCRIFHTSAAGAADAIKQTDSGATGNHITDCEIYHAGSTAGTFYLINQTVGKLGVVSCHFGNANAQLTSAWEIGSGVAAPVGTPVVQATGAWNYNFNPGGSVGAGNTYDDYTPAKRFADQRAAGPFGPQPAP